MFSRNVSSIYIALYLHCICIVFAFTEVRRCQIMIGLWQYGISEMGFGRPRLKCHVSSEFLYAHTNLVWLKSTKPWRLVGKKVLREFRFSFLGTPKQQQSQAAAFWYSKPRGRAVFWAARFI